MMSHDGLVTLKEGIKEVRLNADALANKVPFVNKLNIFGQSPKENEHLLQHDEVTDLDQTYLPMDDNEYSLVQPLDSKFM